MSYIKTKIVFNLFYENLRINTIISGFAARGADYESLTPVQKTKAGNLLKHSVFDVEGLEKLLEIISAEDALLVKRILRG